MAARSLGIKTFWANIISTSITAWATGNSAATIPVNLEAAKRIGFPEDIREVVNFAIYGFLLDTLPIISMVGTLVDLPATMINSVGDNV